MKQVYCLRRCNVFLPFSPSVCSVRPRHGAAKSRILRCCCVSFVFSGAVFCPNFLCRAKKFGLVLYFDTNSRYNKIVFCCSFYAAAAYTLPGKTPAVLPKESNSRSKCFWGRLAAENVFRLIFYNSYILFVFSRKEFF